MKSILKKGVKTNIAIALTEALQKLDLSKPSKKTKKAMAKLTKRLNRDIKRQARKAVKKLKSSKKEKAADKRELTKA